jgi:hypothetical protein
MAYLVLEIPDGDFCESKTKLGCLYAEFSHRIEHCNIFNADISISRIIADDICFGTEPMRVHRKCDECLKMMKSNNKDNNIIDTGKTWEEHPNDRSER